MAKNESQGAGDVDQKRSHVASSVSAGKRAATAAEPDRGDTVARRSSGQTELPPQFGRYRVKKKLGGGGMGTVYLVENTELEREEALKVPHFSDGDDPQLRERFLREAKSAAKLDHANLCPIYDAGVQDGIYFLTMRFLKGRLLSDYSGKPQPERKAVEIVAKLAQALETAHVRDVIHRDLKPSNIMMVAGAGPVVMDFGLAKQVQQAETKLTQAGSMLGTPAYMPPEQVNGDLERMGPASDIYSLGVILYELLTGRLPFEGTMAAIFGQILYTEPPLPSTLVPELNPALDAICQKAMAKASTDRYPSMKAFAAALMDFLRSTPATAGAGNLVPNTADKAAIFQAATVARGRQPAGQPDIFQAQTVVPGPLADTQRERKAPSVAKDRSPPPARPRVWSSPRVVTGIACALITIAIGFWAVAVFRVRTADGILVVQVNEPDADVYVDGKRVTVAWQNGGLKAEIGVKPGTRKVELKKEGFRVYGEEVTLEDQGRTVLVARLEPIPSTTPPQVTPAADASQPETGKKGEPAGGNGESPAVAGGSAPPPSDESIPIPTAIEVPPQTNGETVNQPETLPVRYKNSLGMEFVLVPKGTFWMGGHGGLPGHKSVEIPEDFDMGVTEVTQAQWQALMGYNPSFFSHEGGGKLAVKNIPNVDLKKFPVENVSWLDTQEFLKKLNDREQTRGRLYRLPTDAEWEYACRGGTTMSREESTHDFYLSRPSNDLSSLEANFDGNQPSGKAVKGPFLGRPSKVGSYPPNRLGLYDMHGNANEWCQDNHENGLPLIRGGEFQGPADNCSAFHRGWGAGAREGLGLSRRPNSSSTDRRTDWHEPGLETETETETEIGIGTGTGIAGITGTGTGKQYLSRNQRPSPDSTGKSHWSAGFKNHRADTCQQCLQRYQCCGESESQGDGHRTIQIGSSEGQAVGAEALVIAIGEVGKPPLQRIQGEATVEFTAKQAGGIFVGIRDRYATKDASQIAVTIELID